MTEPSALAKALVAFQAELPTVAKSKTATVRSEKGSFSYTYAGLAEVSGAAMPLLTKHGLAFSCCPRRTDSGHYELVGILLHESGEEKQGALPISGGTPQQLGSAITYARRYLFGSMTGLITDDDDDGHLASQPKRAPAKKAQRVKAAPEDDPFYDSPPRLPEDRQVSGEQLKKIGAQMHELGMTDRPMALRYVADVIGREVESRNELTRGEASRLIDALTKDAEQPFRTPAPETPGGAE